MVLPAMIAINTVSDFFGYIFESDAAKAARLHNNKDSRLARMKTSFPEPMSSEQLTEVANNLKAKGANGIPAGADL